MEDEAVHRLINEGIQRDGLASTSDWRDKSKRVGGYSFQSLYVTASLRKVKGKSFFGHGSWDKYVEEHHGVVSLRRHSISDERLHALIAQGIRKAGASALKWKESRSISDGVQGHSLSTLYILAYTRRKNQRVFFGHGTWYDYLEKHHSVIVPNRKIANPRLSDLELHRLILQVVKKHGVSHWVTALKSVEFSGRKLYSLYYLVKQRKVNRTSFFGHGSLKTYVTWLRASHEIE